MAIRTAGDVVVERRGDQLMVVADLTQAIKGSKSGRSDILAEANGPFDPNDKSLRLQLKVYRVKGDAELPLEVRQAKLAEMAKKLGLSGGENPLGLPTKLG